MLPFVNFNGRLLPADQPIFAASARLPKYGDGLFETIRIFKGQFPFFQHHFQRLQLGMDRLNFVIPNDFNAAFFQNEIQKLIGNSANARVRLTVFRQGTGAYCPQMESTQFLIEARPLEHSTFQWNTAGLKIDLCTQISLDFNYLSALKTCNSLPYIVAAQYAQQQGLDDCLLLNSAGHLVEASSSNLFVFQNEELFTPNAEQGAIAGTTQKVIINITESMGIKVNRSVLSQAHLATASEVFLSNAIQGIRWVKSYQNHQYSSKKTRKLFTALVEKTLENPKK